MALRLGRTVAELEDDLTSKEFGEWVEFFHVEPFGWEAECYRAGIVAATIANVNRDPKKRNRPFEAAEFVPGGYERKRLAKIDGKKLKAQLITAYAGVNLGRNDKLQDQRASGARAKAVRPRAPGGAKGRG